MDILKSWKLPRTFLHKSKSWIFVVYVIMAVYLVIDGAAFMVSRYSGRISTIFCHPNDQGQSECTFTIHGFTETYQGKYLAKNVRRVIETVGFPYGTTDSHACGIDIYTDTGVFTFVHTTQFCYRTEKAVDRIVHLFSLGESSPTKTFIYIGFHFSIFRRIFILVIGLFIVLWWGKSWSLVPVQKTAQKENNKDFSKWLTLSWLRINILLKAFFYLSVFYIQGIWMYGYTTGRGDFINTCNSFFRNHVSAGNWPATSLNVLVCLYPLIIFAILQAYIQWKFLREMFSVSSWWINAPIIACFTLVFDLPANITCQDCSNLKYLLSGSIFTLGESAIIWQLAFYLLVVGLIQWLVLRRRLVNSSGWILIPLVNVSIAPILYMVINPFSIISTLGNMRFLILIPLLFMAFLGDIVTSVFLSRVVYSNKKDLLNRNCED